MFGLSGVDRCECGPGANLWIQYWFADCIYTHWEMVAFFIGLSSMIFWLIAQLPQFITNFLNQSAEALSPWFIFQWLAGDTLNFLGCLFTGDQLVTETLTACYFIFSDIAILSQFVYYHIRNRDKSYILDESVHKPSHGYLDVAGVSEPALRLQDLLGRAAVSATSTDVGRVDIALHSALQTDGKQFGCSRQALQCALQHPALPVERVGMVKQDETVVDLRKEVRRVISVYGLEYGPPKTSRLSVDLLQRLNKHRMSTLSEKLVTKSSAAIKVVAGVSGLLLLGPTRSWMSSSRAGEGKFSRKMLGRSSRVDLATDGRRGTGWSSGRSSWQMSLSSGNSVGRKLLTICGSNDNLLWVRQVGFAFGWGSSALYVGSRLAQLLKNHQRQSAEGLSMVMLLYTTTANLTYAASILMRTKSWDELSSKAPWILGSLSTVFLDITIFFQAISFSRQLARKANKEPDELTPLLA